MASPVDHGSAKDVHFDVISLDPTSSWNLSLTHQRYLLKLLKHIEVHYNKLIHGSVFPLPITAWDFLGDLTPSKILRINRMANPIQRDFWIKKELGFPKEVFTRVGKLITRLGKI